jgi:hypothetical protein
MLIANISLVQRFTGGSSEPPPHRPDAEGVFGDVFEDLLRPEVEKQASWWTYLGAASGAGLGFIIANIPGCKRLFFCNFLMGNGLVRGLLLHDGS